MDHSTEVEEVSVPAGIVTFGTAWTDADYEHFVGYRLGNGQTLVIQSFADDRATVLRLVSDKDAQEVNWRLRCKQMDLALLEFMGEDYSQSAVDAVQFQDLFRHITLLPMPEVEPLKVWPCEVEARAKYEAKVTARREQWARKQEEEEMAQMVQEAVA